jgi:hypothetical protein
VFVIRVLGGSLERQWMKDVNFAEAFAEEPVIDDEEAYYSDELVDVMDDNDDTGVYQQFTKKQQTTLRRILMEIESLMTSLGDRVVETLRRKNEAMKQTYKRERQDPFYELMPLVSPVCLEDDASALQLQKSC